MFYSIKTLLHECEILFILLLFIQRKQFPTLNYVKEKLGTVEYKKQFYILVPSFACAKFQTGLFRNLIISPWVYIKHSSPSKSNLAGELNPSFLQKLEVDSLLTALDMSRSQHDKCSIRCSLTVLSSLPAQAWQFFQDYVKPESSFQLGQPKTINHALHIEIHI